jgi:hypothetical protein
MIKLKTLLEQTHYADPMARQYWLEKRAPAIAAQFGEQLDRVLGGGSNGVAFLLRSGKVMKLTNDRWEVAAASRYRTKQNIPHLVSVYDVRPVTGELVQTTDPEFKSISDYHKEYFLRFNSRIGDLYAIIMDYVTPFDDNEKGIWYKIHGDYLSTRFSDELTAMELADKMEGSRFKVPEGWADRLIAQRQSVLSAFKRNNIMAYEAHGDNMGWNKQGQLVHYDFWMLSQDGNSMQGTPRRLNKPVKYDASGIDTPNNPDM